MIVSYLLILMQLGVKHHRVLVSLDMGAYILYIKRMTVLFTFVPHRTAVTSRKAVELLYHQEQQPCLFLGNLSPHQPLHRSTSS